MAILNVKGIVLKQVNLNESDKIITILTQECGKIEAIAKGCRKPKSELLTATQIFAVSNFVIYEGQNLGRITKAELLQSFYKLHEDLTLLTYATYFAEVANAISVDTTIAHEVFMLICNALYYMTQNIDNIRLTKIAYQLKIANIAGIRPIIEYCTDCESITYDKVQFNIEAGGIICDKCVANHTSSVSISAGSIELIKMIYQTKISQLPKVKSSKKVFDELDLILNRFLETHLDERFKSLKFLMTINSME